MANFCVNLKIPFFCAEALLTYFIAPTFLNMTVLSVLISIGRVLVFVVLISKTMSSYEKSGFRFNKTNVWKNSINLDPIFKSSLMSLYFT